MRKFSYSSTLTYILLFCLVQLTTQTTTLPSQLPSLPKKLNTLQQISLEQATSSPSFELANKTCHQQFFAKYNKQLTNIITIQKQVISGVRYKIKYSSQIGFVMINVIVRYWQKEVKIQSIEVIRDNVSTSLEVNGNGKEHQGDKSIIDNDKINQIPVEKKEVTDTLETTTSPQKLSQSDQPQKLSQTNNKHPQTSIQQPHKIPQISTSSISSDNIQIKVQTSQPQYQYKYQQNRSSQKQQQNTSIQKQQHKTSSTEQQNGSNIINLTPKYPYPDLYQYPYINGIKDMYLRYFWPYNDLKKYYV